MKNSTNNLYLISVLTLMFAMLSHGQTMPITQTQKLIANETVISAGFGTHVALDGDTAVIGVPGEKLGGYQQVGAVHVFVRRKGVWINQAKLLAADGYVRQHFGHSVAISGDTIVVGVPASTINGRRDQGAIYVFERAGDNWEKQVKLVASDGAKSHGLGSSVGISGDTIVAGAPGEFDSSAKPYPDTIGAAYIFTRMGGNWSERAKLKETDKSTRKGLGFGLQVAIDDKTAVITSVTSNLVPDYVHVFSDDGTGWKQEQRVSLIGSVDSKKLVFGVLQNIALDRGTFIIGGVYAGSEPAAAVQVFVRGKVGWVEQAQLVAPSPYKIYPFGWNADISGDTVVIGNPWSKDLKGSAVVFRRYLDRDKWVWKLENTLFAADGKIVDVFGSGVAIDGKTIFIGASGFDVNRDWGEGAAYVFEIQDESALITGARTAPQRINLSLDTRTNRYSLIKEGDDVLIRADGVQDPITGLSLAGSLKLILGCNTNAYIIQEEVVLIGGVMSPKRIPCKRVYNPFLEIIKN